MLLRNIDPNNGLCNRTRLLCHNLREYFIDIEILTWYSKATRVFFPKIPLKTSEDENLPFDMIRKQFPVKKLTFTLMINKLLG